MAFKKMGMTPEEALVPVVMAQLRKAKKGDTAAYCAVRDTIDGKPVQPTANESETPKLVSLALLGAAAELLDRIPGKRLEKDITPKEPVLAGKV